METPNSNRKRRCILVSAALLALLFVLLVLNVTLGSVRAGLGPAALLLPLALVVVGAYRFHDMRRAQAAANAA